MIYQLCIINSSIIIVTVINLQEQYGGWSAHSSLLDSCPTELPSHEEASQVMFIVMMTMFDHQDRLDTWLRYYSNYFTYVHGSSSSLNLPSSTAIQKMCVSWVFAFYLSSQVHIWSLLLWSWRSTKENNLFWFLNAAMTRLTATLWPTCYCV